MVWIQTALRRSIKNGYPSQSNVDPSAAYSQLDFDDDDEFKNFFIKYRLIILECIKIISLTDPIMPLSIVDEWLRSTLSPGSAANQAGKIVVLLTLFPS